MSRVVQPTPCSHCGDIIRIPVSLVNIPSAPGFVICVCSACQNPLPPSLGNNYSNGHYDDDPSGASASWDIVVRLFEESRTA